MTNLEQRLIQSFMVVFPSLTEAEIPKASVVNVPDWDSVATINLWALLQEEFSVEFAMEETEMFTSYELILEVLKSRKIE